MVLLQDLKTEVFKCRKCGNENVTHFSVSGQCTLCEDCAGHDDNSDRMLPSVLHTLRYIAAAPLDRLFSFKVSDEVFAQLKDITDRYLETYRRYDFNSLHFIEENIIKT